MSNGYILAIDQSTQGTKVLLIDQHFQIIWKDSLKHQQIINDLGWISHDLTEIKSNIYKLIQRLLDNFNIDDINAVAITNQRETAAAWSKKKLTPLAPAIVWQCNRAKELVKELATEKNQQIVKQKTGLNLSPYFSAAKFAWLLRNDNNVHTAAINNDLAFGTIDSWLLAQLTNGTSYETEVSNACRTQLLNLQTGQWDTELCKIFGLSKTQLPEIVPSNTNFGTTNLFGLSQKQIPILSILGDSQAALYAHGCFTPGSFKVTFGTGSSVMLNLGTKLPSDIENNLNTSLAWDVGKGKNYVLEGNINYAGATITWLKDKLNLIKTAEETEICATTASPNDTTYLIPAFTGLGAPYWLPNLQAAFVGMDISTGKNELIKAALDSLVYQITDILTEFTRITGYVSDEIHVDGGMIKNQYLMQMLSDITQKKVIVSEIQELSALGTALNATNSLISNNKQITSYQPHMSSKTANNKHTRWLEWINVLNKR